MLKITVLLFGRINPFHWMTHVSAIITDLDTEQSFKIHYPFMTNGCLIDNFRNSLYSQAQNSSCMSVVNLYSNKKFANFLQAFQEENVHRRDFSWFTNNCADQVNFVLRYFFPEPTQSEAIYSYYQSTLGICCLLTLGCSLFPAPKSISTPRDIHNRAWLLSFTYGNPDTIPAAEQQNAVAMPLLPVTPAAEEGQAPFAVDPVEWLSTRMGLTRR